MSEIKQNITNELSEEELENIAGGFGHPTMDDPRCCTFLIRFRIYLQVSEICL